MACSQDSDVFDSWEDIEDSDVLDRQLNEFLPLKQSLFRESNRAPVNMIIVGEDALRTHYVPPEPTVKILKRPSQNCADKFSLNGDSRPRQPIKSLRQREQEYAEARLRILGEAKSPDESCENNSKLVTGVLRSSEVLGVIRMPRGPDGTSGFKVRR